MKYNKVFLLVFALLGKTVLDAQQPVNIDSLITAGEHQPVSIEKAETLNRIINYYMYRAPGKSRQYAVELLKLSNDIEYDEGKSLALYQLGVYYNNQDQTDSARFYYNASLAIADKINNATHRSKAYRGLAIIEFSQGNLLKADSINNMDLLNTIKNGDTVGTALAYDFKGTINQNKGYYSIALENVLKGLNLFEMLGDSIRIADAYNHLATLEYNLGNYRKSIAYNQTALKIYESHHDIYYQAQALNDIGVMYMKLNRAAEALSFYNRSLDKSKEANVKSIQAATLSNMGAAYILLKDQNKATDYLKQAVSLSKSIHANRRIAIAENKLAEVALLEGNPGQAVIFAGNAKQYADENQNISIKSTALKHLSEAYEMMNNAPLALSNYKAYKTLSDSIINEKKIKKIEALRIQFDSEKKEDEIALQNEKIKALNIQAENDKLTKILFGTGMFSFIAISGLLYFGFRQRIKRIKIEHEKQEEIYRQEIEFKKKELASQTLHLVQKSTFIQELKENLEKINRSPELFKIEFKRIVMLLKKQGTEDKDWEIFKSYFSEVHNNFDEKLKSVAKGISESEIRLASFLRMKLTTKEIASILNVLPDSVLKSKYRLKKKLQLDKAQDLSVYLNSI